ncbi:MAG: hypothetical protein H6Q00_47 [Holophagaceae bacterium]|nr:hypothetical protein [Holophagaceae bacterium]
MKKKILIASALALLSFLQLGAVATAPVPLADSHKAKGMACEDCHGKGPRKPVEAAQCFQCHESYAKVAERTKGLKPNPHDNHMIDLDCGFCHKGHKPFELYCSTCHIDLKFERK